MKRTRARIRSILAAAAIACVAVGGASQARNAPGSIARAQLPEDAGCFGLNWSSMINNCGSVKAIEAPLSTDSYGTYTVRVNALGASPSANVGCRAVGTDAGVQSIYATDGNRWLPAFGTPQTLTTSAYVPPGGRLFVICDMYPGGRVNSFNWPN
jgi:hypothetical protein